MGTASAGELQWRRGRAEASRAPQQEAAQRFVPQRPAKSRVDFAVRPAAAEDEDGPRLGSGGSGTMTFRSVVVERNDEADALRSAQLPSSPTAPSSPGGAPPAAGAESQFDEELRSPFIDTPAELPPLTEPPAEELEAPALPEEPQTQPGRTDRQPGQQPSTEFQPRLQPRDATAPPLPPDTPAVSEETLEAEREKSQAACSQGFEDLRAKTIDKLDLTIAVVGEEGSDYPHECTLEDAWHAGRCWDETTYLWKASALCHKPLYFEQEQLERYGHSCTPCLAPLYAGAHFFTRLPVLPYCMGVEPPCECVYALGHYRPGNCAPYMCNPIPISPRGAVFQAGAVWGAAAILP